jgi:hypothetical protein
LHAVVPIVAGAVAIAIIVAVIAIVVATGGGPQASAAADQAAAQGTCRDLVELLQAKGMECRFLSCPHKHPAVYLVTRKVWEDYDWDLLHLVIDDFRRSGTLHLLDLAVIVQYPTAAEAREEAGTMPAAFSWGRFVIFGKPEVVKQIRSLL